MFSLEHYFSFPKMLAASLEHMLLQCFSLPVIAEVMFCMEMQQTRSKDTTAAHSALVCSSDPGLPHSSPLGSAFVNLYRIYFTGSKPVLSVEAKCPGLTLVDIKGLRCPFCCVSSAGM